MSITKNYCKGDIDMNKVEEKVVTIREYIDEVERYPYTKEHFDLVKECHEIEMMWTYLDSQAYLQENMDMSEEFRTQLLAESVEVDEVFVENLSQKIGNVFAAIKKLAKNIFTGIINFFSKIGSKVNPNEFPDLVKRAQGILGSSTQLDQEQRALLEKQTRALRRNGLMVTARPILFNCEDLISKCISAVNKYIGIMESTTGIYFGDISSTMAKLAVELKKNNDKEQVVKVFELDRINEMKEKFIEYGKSWSAILEKLDKIDAMNTAKTDAGRSIAAKVADRATGKRYIAGNVGTTSDSNSILSQLKDVILGMRTSCVNVINDVNDAIKEYNAYKQLVDRLSPPIKKDTEEVSEEPAGEPEPEPA